MRPSVLARRNCTSLTCTERTRRTRPTTRGTSVGLATCPLCRQGALRMIAAIPQAEVIRTMLRHLQRAAAPPPMAPARSRQAAVDWVA